MTLEPEILPQAAVIPIRKDKAGNIQVLLVRREDKNKWGLPKGIIESDQTPEEAARAEAMEEAGISGKLSAKPVSRYTYRKKGRICHVTAFLMKVNDVHPYFDEQHIRERCWFSLPELTTLPIRRRVRPIIDKLPQLIAEFDF